MKKCLISTLFVLAASSAALRAQDSPLAWAAGLEQDYMIVPNVTYGMVCSMHRRPRRPAPRVSGNVRRQRT
jgi:hypothetical protein